MPSGIFGISSLGLNAAQLGIRTTQNNISNVNTLGYHRQGSNFATTLPNLTGSGSIGSGVNVPGLSRSYDRFLENELLFSQSQLARHEAYSNYASRIDSVLGGEDSGLNSVLNKFFSSVNEVANAPTSLVARQAMLTTGTNLTRRFGDLDQVIKNTQQSLNQQMQGIATQVTNYARQIAEINTKVNTLQTTGSDLATNGLLDQRDQLAAEINKLVGANVVVQTDGSYNLFIGSGQSLVAGGHANSMSVVADPNDPTQKLPALRVGSSDIALGGEQITGGMLGGLLAFRDDVLIPSQRQLGSIAFSLVSEFNAQHALGFDLDGVAGGDFFSPPAVQAASGNTGNAIFKVSIDNSNLMSDGGYQLDWDGTDYSLTRLSDATVFTGASLAALNTAIAGEGLSISQVANGGVIAIGDSYDVRSIKSAAYGLSVAVSGPDEIAAAGDDPGELGLQSLGPGDNSNALSLAGLQMAEVLEGSSTLGSTYNQLVSNNAALASSADINVTAYDSLTQQATAAQQSFSGVNLDEEAANLIQYQQAYQASARAMQIASSLFEEILSIAR